MGVDVELFFDTGFAFTDADVVDWNWRLCEAVGRAEACALGGEPLVTRTPKYDDESGDCGTGAPLRVRTMHRYYGPGYERGPWPIIYAMIHWLRLNFPNGKVWYGGDSGETLEIVDDAFCSAMWAHWAKVGGEPYYRGRGDEQGGPQCCGRPITLNAWRTRGGVEQRGGYCPACSKHYWIEGGKLLATTKNFD